MLYWYSYLVIAECTVQPVFCPVHTRLDWKQGVESWICCALSLISMVTVPGNSVEGVGSRQHPRLFHPLTPAVLYLHAVGQFVHYLVHESTAWYGCIIDWYYKPHCVPFLYWKQQYTKFILSMGISIHFSINKPWNNPWPLSLIRVLNSELTLVCLYVYTRIQVFFGLQHENMYLCPQIIVFRSTSLECSFV
jgi:hypothetical protein